MQTPSFDDYRPTVDGYVLAPDYGSDRPAYNLLRELLRALRGDARHLKDYTLAFEVEPVAEYGPLGLEHALRRYGWATARLLQYASGRAVVLATFDLVAGAAVEGAGRLPVAALRSPLQVLELVVRIRRLGAKRRAGVLARRSVDEVAGLRADKRRIKKKGLAERTTSSRVRCRPPEADGRPSWADSAHKSSE